MKASRSLPCWKILRVSHFVQFERKSQLLVSPAAAALRMTSHGVERSFPIDAGGCFAPPCIVHKGTHGFAQTVLPSRFLSKFCLGLVNIRQDNIPNVASGWLCSLHPACLPSSCPRSTLRPTHRVFRGGFPRAYYDALLMFLKFIRFGDVIHT